MSLDILYIAKTLKKLASTSRFTGSTGEAKAKEFIVSQLESFGLYVKLQPFQVDVYNIEKARLEVLNPPLGVVACHGIGFSGVTPDEGVEGDLIFIDRGDKLLVPTFKNWIGLASSRPLHDDWKFISRFASGLVIAEDNPHRRLSHVSIPYEWYRKFGSLPSVYVSFEDAFKLLKARRVKILLKQKFSKVNSHNIIGVIEGSKYPDEIIMITAHYDSVYNVKGAVDNAGGTAFVLALAKLFSEKKPLRTLKFALFSGEELGLRGSLSYVEEFRSELDKVRLVVNLDVHGTAFGSSNSIITGPEKLKNYVEALADEIGTNINIVEDIVGSDGISFAKEGIPVVNFARFGGSGVNMHTELDDDRFVHEVAYLVLGRLVAEFLNRIANSEKLPFAKEIPDKLKKKVDEYFKKRLGIFDGKE
ncbi:MAG: hypothetical protein DRJ44_03275 [Thermoprotei archaeon]|nr:MAG: hypothetical protein DRJ44_03275 [Thermoprotei archaeon]